MKAKQDGTEGSFSHEIMGDLCVVTGKGRITLNSSIQAMTDLIKNPDYSSDLGIIVDLRQINYHPTYGELMDIKENLVFLKKNFKNKIALVTSQKMLVLAEIVTVFSKMSGLKISSFSDYDRADKWVKKED